MGSGGRVHSSFPSSARERRTEALRRLSGWLPVGTAPGRSQRKRYEAELRKGRSQAELGNEWAPLDRGRVTTFVIRISSFVILVVFFFPMVGMQRVVGGEEEVPQPHRHRTAPQRARFALGQRLQIERVLDRKSTRLNSS